MIRYLHIAQTLDKEVKRLQKAGKQAEQAVARYEEILATIRTDSCQARNIANKRTKKGEQRIKSCVKYDLGGGYRLVTVRVADRLFVPFVGSHDDTDQWFARHRYDRFLPDPALYQTENLPAEDQAGDETQVDELKEVELTTTDGYEERLQQQLDESLLKEVFQGLLGSGRRES